MKMRRDLFLLFSLLIIFNFTSAQSQEKYPVRPIDIIVGVSPGGSNDTAARVTADYLKAKWGVPVNVLNKPGGNTVPATLEVYRANPDGYTIFLDSLPTTSTLPTTVKDLPFETMDRTFIGMVTIAPVVFIVPTASPCKNLNDVRDEAKKSPETFTWTSLSGTPDIGAMQFFKAIGVDVRKTKPMIVKGGGETATLTAGGHVRLGVGTVSTIRSVHAAGLVRALAISAQNRWPDLPEVPTTSELGYKTVNILNMNGFSGPPKLPSYVVDKWEKTLREMAGDTGVATKMKNVGLTLTFVDAKETREHIIKEIDLIAELYKLAK